MPDPFNQVSIGAIIDSAYLDAFLEENLPFKDGEY